MLTPIASLIHFSAPGKIEKKNATPETTSHRTAYFSLSTPLLRRYRTKRKTVKAENAANMLAAT
jgi:hypothetical protein